MRRLVLFLFFFFLLLTTFFFIPLPLYAQSCSVTDYRPGELSQFTASGLQPNHNYAIRVTSDECNFQDAHCVASDAQGSINTWLPWNFQCNGMYQALLAEVRFSFPCSANTDINYCSPTFMVTGGQPPGPEKTCNKQCALPEDKCTPSCVGVPLNYKCRLEEGAVGTSTCCCYPPGQFPGEVTPFDPCKNIEDSNTQNSCYLCVGKPEEPTGNSWTAIGCITTSDPQAFIAWLLGAAIGIAGGIAFLLMLWGGFQIITSTGDPEKLNRGKEILTSAIIGLVVIVFSVFLLKLIGVDILQLPGFEK